MQAARSSNTNDVCGSADRDALKVRHASVYKIIKIIHKEGNTSDNFHEKSFYKMSAARYQTTCCQSWYTH